MIKAHDFLTEIQSYKPGKSGIVGGGRVFKLSSNENALGASSKAVAAYKNHGDEVFRYAEGSCAALREGLAKKNGIAADRIVCGAGSDEILALLTQAFAGVGDEVIYSKHGFLMYPISAKRVGAVPVAVAEKGLKCDVEAIFSAVNEKTRIIFIANPNNPTGSYLVEDEVVKLVENVPSEVLIVLDHAYDEFAKGAPGYPDAAKLVEKYENVVMTRTFSKVYGLASLRIGWCYSSLAIAEVLHKIRGPFNVSGAAQEAALAALGDEEFLAESVAHNQRWLERFFAEIAGIDGVKAWPSVGNFVLLDFGDEGVCQKANAAFLAQGIIVREMAGYHLPSCLRVSIGRDEENEAVLGVLRGL